MNYENKRPISNSAFPEGQLMHIERYQKLSELAMEAAATLRRILQTEGDKDNCSELFRYFTDDELSNFVETTPELVGTLNQVICAAYNEQGLRSERKYKQPALIPGVDNLIGGIKPDAEYDLERIQSKALACIDLAFLQEQADSERQDRLINLVNHFVENNSSVLSIDDIINDEMFTGIQRGTLRNDLRWLQQINFLSTTCLFSPDESNSKRSVVAYRLNADSAASNNDDLIG